jgi:hypothetical protein
MELGENTGWKSTERGAQIAMASATSCHHGPGHCCRRRDGAALRKCAGSASADLSAAIPVSINGQTPHRFRAPGCAGTFAITSDNLVRLDAWKAISGYNEDYFVDSVDFEFAFGCVSREAVGSAAPP